MAFVRRVCCKNDTLIHAWKFSKIYLESNDGFVWKEIDFKVQNAEKGNETKSTSQWFQISEFSRVAECDSLHKIETNINYLKQ